MVVAVSDSIIARSAFRHMELRELQGYGDDTKEATAAREMYPEALGMMLEAYDWAFARRLSKPALVADVRLAGVADPELPHVFQLPYDILKIRRVSGTACLQFRQDGFLLRANEGSVIVRATHKITNEKQLPHGFKAVVALQLAVLLSPRFVTSRTKRRELKDDLQGAWEIAITSDHTTASVARADDLDHATGDDWVGQVLR